MSDVGASEIIRAPVHEVFETMSRLETLPEWLVGCVEAWPVTDDPYRVGGRVGHVDEVMGQRFEAHYEVVAWEEGRCFVFETLSGGPFRGVSEVTFSADGGSTKVEIRIKGELRGAFRYAYWAARKVAQKQLVESVQNAKRMIETRK